MSSYPQTWTITNLFEVCQPRQWKTISTKELTQAGYTVYGANGVIGFYNQYTHEAPTLMITCRGATCGNLHISKPFSYINGNAMALDHLNESICSMSYLHRFLQARGFDDVISGSAQPQITQEGLRKVDIPIAPRQEQKRIADKLDTVLTRVDAVNTRLARVAPLLKRFRQSVLAAATSGRLTEDWRAGQPDISEWKTEKLNDLGELGRGKSKHRPRNDPRLYGGVHPFVQTGDVANANQWITSHKQTYSDFGLDQSKLWPANTLCITIAANIADTALLSYPACFPDSVVGFVANEACCLPRFIKWSIDVRKDDLERLAPATAQKNINLGVLEEVEIHLPSLEEQTEIVRRVETLFAFADRLEARLAQAQTAATRLTPALLAKAFRGELVPQDPNDEPAAELLRRLQAERATAPKASAGRGRKAVVQS